ncbi:hypothetical protein HGRIS_002195 [Hohenbuehelia grisea]|uniref:Uncharacterized protein n=1 Tax=Hohenbuehelia grisea TaxID=104357 RepID=A0ABR3JJZ7_9AGAR
MSPLPALQELYAAPTSRIAKDIALDPVNSSASYDESTTTKTLFRVVARRRLWHGFNLRAGNDDRPPRLTIRVAGPQSPSPTLAAERDPNPPPPYTPSVVLHATIVPSSEIPSSRPASGSSGSSSRTRPKMTSSDIALIVATVVLSVIFCAILGVIYRVLRQRKGGFMLPRSMCIKRKVLLKRGTGGARGFKAQSGGLGLSSEDADWCIATLKKDLKTEQLEGSDSDEKMVNDKVPPEPTAFALDTQEKRHTNSAKPVAEELHRDAHFAVQDLDTSTVAIPDLASQDKGFQERIQTEEEDIASALNIALRASQECDLNLDGSSVDAEPYPLPSGCSMESFDSERDIAHGYALGSPCDLGPQEALETAFAISMSPDSSTGSAERLSLADMSSADTESMVEVVELLKRSQTRSIEMQRGLLVTLSPTIEAASCFTPNPYIVITDEAEGQPDPQPNAPVVADPSTEVQEPFDACTTEQAIASIINSGATENLSASSSTLLVPLPSLVVTHPSSGSLAAMGASLSTVSVDLGDFPNPPAKTPLPRVEVTVPVADIDFPVYFWDEDAGKLTVQGGGGSLMDQVDQFIAMYD